MPREEESLGDVSTSVLLPTAGHVTCRSDVALNMSEEADLGHSSIKDATGSVKITRKYVPVLTARRPGCIPSRGRHMLLVLCGLLVGTALVLMVAGTIRFHQCQDIQVKFYIYVYEYRNHKMVSMNNFALERPTYQSSTAVLDFNGYSELAVDGDLSTCSRTGASVCYGDLGCFDTGRPFFSLQRPVNFLPQSPNKIDTKFRLFTRANNKQWQMLNSNDYSSIRTSYFSASKPTKIVSHGFLEGGVVDWMVDMKSEFLKNGDYNVILVDWGGGSSFPYTQATANTRLVGAEIAKLIKILKEHTGANPADFHIIGHSLGAHIAGYAGERTMNLGRITGFGLSQAVGHVDYYPNSGHDQPGCDKDPISSITLEGNLYDGGKQFIACNHLRSYTYFTESINSKCPFEGYSCSDYTHFKSGTCMPCTGSDCGYMGYHADRAKPTQGRKQYYLITGASAPFCSYTEYLSPGKSYSYVVTAPHDLGAVQDVVLQWKKNSGILNPFQWNPFNLRHPTLFFKRIDVVSGETRQQSVKQTALFLS
ncbi:hypothetical protein FSP39_015779 [Pinctada imbricata]|uniref:Lipase domain-containing protein n=1 Tax=Pinctada imbricata TaxID=66713 RepID=A0AA89BR31_PINIB|nr:hypothetical protein FSP39_015779 [Pinctada imbricata]